MKILGLSNGSIKGNSEIMLKAALLATKESRPDVELAWIHVPSVLIPRNPAPLKGSMDISMGTNSNILDGGKSLAPDSIDDRPAVLNAILDADAIIVSSSTYSHQPGGLLKALMDRIGGPYLDVGFAKMGLEKKAAGNAAFTNFQPDPRLLKPRVVAFAMVGGSTTPDQFSMALPTMHLYFYCLHAKVVDQFVAKGCANPGAVLLYDELLERAKQLGRNVASQLGKAFDDAQYLGPSGPSSCPNCHLSHLEIFDTNDNAIGCTTCGTRGKLVIKDGKILPEWENNSIWSCITMVGKAKHVDDILSTGGAEKPRIASIESEWQRWSEMMIPRVALPSDVADR